MKEQLRGIPDKGIGYGALRYLGEAELRAQFDGLAAPRVTFNYLGQFDQSFDEDSLFVPARESAGHGRGDEAPLDNWLSIDGQVLDGELSLAFTYSRRMYDPATVEALAKDYQAELKAILAHCMSAEAGGLTPSDTPLAGLSQAQIDALPVTAGEIEDIYPLSPMQQGMLFHALQEPEAALYLNQLTVPIEGLDIARFEAALACVFAPVMRSCAPASPGTAPFPSPCKSCTRPWRLPCWFWTGAAAP